MNSHTFPPCSSREMVEKGFILRIIFVKWREEHILLFSSRSARQMKVNFAFLRIILF